MMKTEEKSTSRKFSIWKALVFSFFSKGLYADVGKNWKGTGYGLLFLIVVIVSIPRAVAFQNLIVGNLPGFMKSVPDFQIVKGEFSSPLPQPYIYKWDKGELIIDTTGKYTSLAQVPKGEEMESLFIVTKTQIISHRNRLGVPEDETKPMLKLDSFVANQENLSRWTNAIVEWAWVVFYPVILLLFFVMEAVVLLLYALTGLLLSEISHKGLDFLAVLRLAVISHIPALVAGTILSIWGMHSGWFTLGLILLSLAYLFFAVNAQEKAAPVPDMRH